MQRRLLSFILLIISLNCLSQSSFISGRILDSSLKRGLPYATVSLVNYSDSSLVTFTRADSSGYFKLNGYSQNAKYLLSTSFVGYTPLWKIIYVTEQNLDLGDLFLEVQSSLDEVIVNARRPPVEMRNDTLQFNAENFKTAPNAVVEDLLKRLPGVTVDRDGTIRVNGQQVRSLLVNGKEFFTGDPKLATKNLNADWIDKVEVFDRKSDRAQFTGIDDGLSEKAINLKLKKDKLQSTFGRVTSAGGSNERYDIQGNVNRFNKDKQVSLIAMGNNTNRQGFTLNDILNFNGELQRGMRSGSGGGLIRFNANEDYGLPVAGMGQNQQGIANTLAGGVNFNNKWNNKTELNSNILISDTRLTTARAINRQNLLPGNNFDYISNSITNRDAQQQRLGFTLDHQFDSAHSMKIVPQITFQQGYLNAKNYYNSETKTSTPINNGFSENSNQTRGVNISNSILFRKKYSKKGRTLSFNSIMSYNESVFLGNLYSKNSFYKNGILNHDSIINQKANRDAISRSLNNSVTFTEQIGKRSLLEITSFYNKSSGESNRSIFDFNSGTGKYDQINSSLSNNFESSSYILGATLGIRSNIKKISAGISASIQNAELNTVNKSNSSVIRQQFSDFLPAANFRYTFSTRSSLNINYTSSTQLPSTIQLQPVPDISDPLNVYVGNPNLRRSFIHNINASYTNLNMARGRNLFLVGSFNRINYAIVNADIIGLDGARSSSPINVNGVHYAFFNLNSGFNLRKLKSRLDIGLGLNVNHSISFINTKRNEIQNKSLSPNMSWTFSLENKIDLFAQARLNFNSASYSLQPILNNKFLQQVYSFEMINYISGNLIFTNNLTYTINSGRIDGFNTRIPNWMASISKSFLKNKRGEIKLSIYDILNQNIGIIRNANQNFVEDIRYSVLQRYFTLGFTYILNKSGAASNGPKMMIRTVN